MLIIEEMELKSMSSNKPLLNIMGLMKWVPGGTLIVPMLLTASINTAFPNALSVGGTTTPLFKSGTMAIIGFILFCSGAALNPRSLVELFKKNGAYFVMKIIIMILVAFIAQFLLPPVMAFGIPAAAFFAVMTSTNPGTYLEQANRYGTDVDKASFPLVHLSTTTALIIFVYGVIGAAAGGFNGMAMLALFIPFIIGFVLGNFDPGFGAFFKPGTAMVIPILGANFGASMNLKSAIIGGGLPGLLVSIVYLLLIIPLFLFVDKVILKRPGYQSISWCSVSGACAAIPPLLMAGNAAVEAYIPQAVAIVAMSIIITNLVMPIVNRRVVARWGDANGDRHLED